MHVLWVDVDNPMKWNQTGSGYGRTENYLDFSAVVL
jgi:hypothetical protein